MSEDTPTIPYGYRLLNQNEDVQDGDLIWVDGCGWDKATPFVSAKRIVIRKYDSQPVDNSFDKGWGV